MEDACSIEGLADALEALTEALNEAVDEDVKPEDSRLAEIAVFCTIIFKFTE